MLKNLDKKQKIELFITVLGILILIFLIPQSTKRLHAKKRISAKSTPELLNETEDISVTPVLPDILKKNWKHDPFYPEVPFSATASGLDSFVLNGIVWDREFPYAIINGEVVKVGDNIHGVKIIEITESTVVLEQGTEHYTLKLPTF